MMKKRKSRFAIALTMLLGTFGKAYGYAPAPDRPNSNPNQNVNNKSYVTNSEKLSQQNIDNIRMRVCIALHQGTNTENFSVPDTIRSVIIMYGGIDATAHDVDAQIVRVWNKYADQMICPQTSGLYPTQHVYKRAIEISVYDQALNEFFLQDASKFPFNMNAVETSPNGDRTTLLDYIDELLALPDADSRTNVGQIIRIRRIIEIRYDGKRAREL